MKDHLKATVSVIIAGIVLFSAYFYFANSLDNHQVKSGKNSVSTKSIDSMNVIIESENINKLKVVSREIKSPIIVLNFWASWCGPCVEEVPSLIKMVKKFNGKVHLLAISGDESLEEVQTFVKAFPGLKNNHIDIIWDPKREIIGRYNVAKLPESMIITPEGKLIRKVIGSIDWASQDAEAYFKSLVETK